MIGIPARPLRALAFTLLFTACGGGAEPEKTLDGVHSWSATVSLATQQYRARTVGAAYARQLLGAARDARLQAAQTLVKPGRSPAVRRRVEASLLQLDDDIHLLASELATR